MKTVVCAVLLLVAVTFVAGNQDQNVCKRKFTHIKEISADLEQLMVLGIATATVKVSKNKTKTRLIWSSWDKNNTMEQVLMIKVVDNTLLVGPKDHDVTLPCLTIEIPALSGLDNFIANDNTTIMFEGNISLPYLHMKVVHGRFEAAPKAIISADFVMINQTGIGSIELGASNRLDDVEVHLGGWGDLTVSNTIQNAMVIITGMGDVTLGRVEGSLDVHLHGNGSVMTAGDKDLKIYGEALEPNTVTYLTGDCEVKAAGKPSKGYEPCNGMEEEPLLYTVAG